MEVRACGSSDYMTPRYDFGRRFKISITDNRVWKVKGHLKRDSVKIYTDGSKLNGAVGSGIFSESFRIVQFLRLPDCSIFQAEAVAMQAAARIIEDETVSNLPP